MLNALLLALFSKRKHFITHLIIKTPSVLKRICYILCHCNDVLVTCDANVLDTKLEKWEMEVTFLESCANCTCRHILENR